MAYHSSVNANMATDMDEDEAVEEAKVGFASSGWVKHPYNTCPIKLASSHLIWYQSSICWWSLNLILYYACDSDISQCFVLIASRDISWYSIIISILYNLCSIFIYKLFYSTVCYITSNYIVVIMRMYIIYFYNYIKLYSTTIIVCCIVLCCIVFYPNLLIYPNLLCSRNLT